MPDVFRSLFAAYPDALIVADAAGAIVLANPSAEELLGYGTDELLGLNVDVLVPDAIRPRHAAYREAYSHHPRPRPMGTQVELVARRRDGSEVMVEISLSPLQRHGLPLVVAAIRDIGAYPRVKQALQRARYSEHVAQLGRIAVDARDPQRLVQQVPTIAANALQVGFARVFLVEPDGVAVRVASGVGSIDGEAVDDRIAIRSHGSLDQVLQHGRPVLVASLATESRFELPASYRAAGIECEAVVPLLDRGRVVGMLTARARQPGRFGEDEIRFLESLASLLATSLQRAESEEALKHAQRLESVGQLTGGIAHDFNNLLTVIQGNLQVLDKLPALAGDAHARQLVGAASRASHRGAELTGKLLAFASRQLLQPTAVDVAALLQSLAGMLRRALDQRIRIEIDVAPGCLPVLADAGQLEAALLNMAINARDAMPDGGILRFSAAPGGELGGALGEELAGSIAPVLGYVAISIADTGGGMPDEVKARAFEPFFTTKQAGRGTGLGLSTVYGFAKQSNGAVEIDTTLGVGTTLTLHIPAAAAADGAPARDTAAGAIAIPPGLDVLLVEDDPEVRAVMRTFLETLGCRVNEAASAEQALQGLGAGAPHRLLLTDIALGAGMRGTDLARLVEARVPGIAVLLMSGYSAELIDADRESPAGWELLRKPCSREELAQAIGRVLGPPG
ncbi:MAG TPA: PAS domain S-box protein [Burkholderiaceae bacterium]|nr:PAS domain S-box protein [Burkholderiaceae bacterium]